MLPSNWPDLTIEDRFATTLEDKRQQVCIASIIKR